VANRSEEDSLSPKDEGREADRPFRLSLGRQLRHDDVEFNELDIRLRVSYKTLLLVFVLFDVAHLSLIRYPTLPLFRGFSPELGVRVGSDRLHP